MTTEAPAHGRTAVLVAAALAAVVAAATGGWLAGRSTDRVPSESSVDVGFLRDMSDHHDQAVQLAVLLLANGENEVLRGFATDTIASQRYEIGLMDARLQDWSHGRGSATRMTMTWMGTPTPLAEMAGMVSPGELAELAAARGRDADLLFIHLMTAHHEGGIHMAEHAWLHAETDEVRTLAETIAKVQRMEIRDMQRVRQQLTSVSSPQPPP